MLPDVPYRPPLEVVEQGQVWRVQAYQQGTTFSTHGSQIDAVRAAKTKMDDDRHPCTLRWDSPHSVRNLYWNPLFECLEVRYDELLDAWTIVPEQSTFAMDARETRERACQRAKQIQQKYNFKQLRAFDASAREFETRDHRFLRHDITSSGVRFDPSAIDRPDEPADEPSLPSNRTATGPETDRETDTEPATDAFVAPASPGQLGASIPDVTKVEFVDTDGIVHRYATPWGDGIEAEIIAVSRKYDDSRVREAFDTRLSRWRRADSHPNVATVHESGADPAQWVAYQASQQTLAATGTDVPSETRLALLRQLVDAVGAVTNVSPDPVCGLHPERMHVHSSDSAWRLTVASWGIEWAIQDTVGTHDPTPFTAPEQVDGRLTPATVVYQVGAIAYWLLCESPPVTAQEEIESAIKAGEVSPLRPTISVGTDVRTGIETALATDPDDRYQSVEALKRALT